jgi:hypothetical protein
MSNRSSFRTQIKGILFFLTLTFSFSSFGQKHERVSGWESDIDTLLSLIKKEHYVYKAKPFPAELLAKAKQLKISISSYSDERMLGELEQLTYYLGDGHSYILPISTKFPVYYLPIQFYIFSDGVFIIDATGEYKELIGKKVISINNIPVEKLVKDMNGYIHQDNIYTVKWFAPTVLRFRGIYEKYGLKQASLDIVFKLSDKQNGILTKKILFIPATDFRGIAKLFPSKICNSDAPLYLSNVEKNYWLKKINSDGNKILYFQFNQVQDLESEPIVNFSKRLTDSLNFIKPSLFIIDVRHNNGGNSELLAPLITTIKNFEKTSPKSRIIVITGRNTFSAAQIFISLLCKETHAIFAGEPSSSKPNFVGEENHVFLTYSGAIGSISNRYHETIPGDKRKWIEPSYKINVSSQDYFNNIDPVLNYLLNNLRR